MENSSGLMPLPYLVQGVSWLKDDRWQQQKEEHVGSEHFLFLLERKTGNVTYNAGGWQAGYISHEG